MLGVGVNQQNPVANLGERDSHITRKGCLANPALLVEKGSYFTHVSWLPLKEGLQATINAGMMVCKHKNGGHPKLAKVP
jgi:hypothetical protein